MTDKQRVEFKLALKEIGKLADSILVDSDPIELLDKTFELIDMVVDMKDNHSIATMNQYSNTKLS